MKNRKLQIGPTLSKHSIQHGLGTYHLATLDKLEKNYIHYSTLTTDLRLNPEYQVLFQIYVYLTINTSKKNILELPMQPLLSTENQLLLK